MDSTCTISQKLLYDLNNFIGVILEKEKLSPSAEERRNELRQSLQFFTVPEIEVPSEDEYEDPAPIRVCSQLSNYSLSSQSDDASKLNMSFSELKKMCMKFGPLWQKEKGLFREMWRKYLVGLYEQKLVLYYTDKDLKPTTCVNIQGYVARHAPNIQRDAKKKNITFELMCPGKKDYQFFARTVKDMEQWVAIICQTSIQHIDLTPRSCLASDHRLVISIDNSNMEETYDDATSAVVPNEQEEPEEEFYDDIVESKHTGTPQANPMQDKKPLPLSITHKKDNEEEVEEEEFYNDVEEYEEPSPKPDVKPVMWHTEHKFNVMDHHSPLPTPMKPSHVEEEEEIYHDIVEYQQKLPPKPVPVIKLQKDQPPPLPARRPLPSIPKDNSEDNEEIEETYEDINISIQSHVKQPEQSLQVSGNKINDDDDDIEETYDDIGNLPPNLEKHLELNHQVPESHRADEEEQEEIYDDVGDSESSSLTKNQSVLTNENTNSVINIQNSHYKTGKLANQGKTSELNKKEPVNITINVTTNKADENNQIIIDKKHSIQDTNNSQDKGINQSFLQRKYLGQNRNNEQYINISITKINNEISKQSTDATDTKETNIPQNQVLKQNTNVENIKKFTESTNTSFLHQRNSQKDQCNVSSILQKLQSKNMGSEGNFTSQKSNNSSSQFNNPNDNTALSTEYPASEINPEENTTNFQNAFKKIQASFSTGKKPIGGHVIKPDLPTYPNKPLQSSISPSSESPTNSLRNIQNRPLPAKPTTLSTSSKPLEFPINNSRNKSPNSKATELSSLSSESPSRSSTNSRSDFSSELPANKLNTTSNSPSIEMSISSHQLSSMPPQNKTYLPDKPSMNIKVTVPLINSSQSSRASLNRPRNKSSGLPVSIPNIPDSPTSEPPKLPPRSYLKL